MTATDVKITELKDQSCNILLFVTKSNQKTNSVSVGLPSSSLQVCDSFWSSCLHKIYFLWSTANVTPVHFFVTIIHSRSIRIWCCDESNKLQRKCKWRNMSTNATVLVYEFVFNNSDRDRWHGGNDIIGFDRHIFFDIDNNYVKSITSLALHIILLLVILNCIYNTSCLPYFHVFSAFHFTITHYSKLHLKHHLKFRTDGQRLKLKL